MRPILLIMWTAFQSFILRDNNNNNNTETEGCIIAAQDQAIKTNCYRSKIL